MKDITLQQFIETVRNSWTGLNTDTVVTIRQLLSRLCQSSHSGQWFDDLYSKKTDTVELYKDPQHKFMLLAHTEPKGFYRSPHDHGAGWVFYAVLDGEMEMSTYLHHTNEKGKSYLVSRGSYTMKKGDCHVFLPGDVHDTRCLSDNLILFRLTSCDIGMEKREGRMTVFTG